MRIHNLPDIPCIKIRPLNFSWQVYYYCMLISYLQLIPLLSVKKKCYHRMQTSKLQCSPQPNSPNLASFYMLIMLIKASLYYFCKLTFYEGIFRKQWKTCFFLHKYTFLPLWPLFFLIPWSSCVSWGVKIISNSDKQKTTSKLKYVEVIAHFIMNQGMKKVSMGMALK